MASSKNSAPEKKTEEKLKKKPTKTKPITNPKRNNDNKHKASNGVASAVDARAVDPSSSSDSDHVAENGFEIIQIPISQKKRERGLEERESPSTTKFPMERVRRIARSEDSDLKITNEAVFIFNKATEKFLETFCGEAYACCVQDRKKSLGYKHLSSAVNKWNRYDFLSDFVPVKVKAEDALAEIKSMEP